MSINFTDFSKAPIQDSPVKTMFEDALKGYQMSQEPSRMARDAKKEALANSLQELALKHKPTEYSLEDALKQAQTRHYNAMGSGSGTAKVNGMVANYVATHPNATQDEIRDFADRVSNAQLQGLDVRTQHTQKLTDTQDVRNLTPLLKEQNELRQINEGYFPGTKDQLKPEQQTKLRNDVMLDIVKKTTDPKTRERLGYARNMNITFGDIDVPNLVKYSSLRNLGPKIADAAKEALTKEGSPEYKEYKREVTKATNLAKQMRQFLGDSIQPAANEKLEHLAKPEAWNKSPELAQENFEYIKDLYDRETQTLLGMANDASIYSSNQGQSGQNQRIKVYNPATGRLE